MDWNEMQAAWRGEWVDPDLIPRADLVRIGEAIEIPLEPWVMDVAHIGGPDAEGMVDLTGVDGTVYHVAGDWPVTRFTQSTADLWQTLVLAELEGLPRTAGACPTLHRGESDRARQSGVVPVPARRRADFRAVLLHDLGLAALVLAAAAALMLAAH